MYVTVFLRKERIANLQFEVQASSWTLVSKEMLAEATPEVNAAIERAAYHVKTDVFQPTGRRVELDEVQYVAQPHASIANAV